MSQQDPQDRPVARFYDGIDWRKAWYGAVADAAGPLLQAGCWRTELNRRSQLAGLCNHRGLPIRFIAQEDLPEGQAYEAHISQTGAVPTRENLHDFFNALVWLSFPKVKKQLNALQAAQIAVLGIGKSRGPARDAATIFDENSALLAVRHGAAGDALIEALRGHQWEQVFVEQRQQFSELAELWCFGHALMEKLINPYKAITAHCWIVRTDAGFGSLSGPEKMRWLDQQVSLQLQQEALSNAAYTPLPVAAVPGWWEQQDAAFYQDRQVFRPRRQPS